MKSLFYTSLLAVGMISCANAQSLYGLLDPSNTEETIPLKYRVSASLGYDDNVNATSTHKQSSAFARFGVGATMANWDPRTQYAFDVSLGGIFYLKKMKFGTDQVMSDSTARFSLVHNIDSTLRYAASLGVSYRPEPDYDSGITVGSRAGEYLLAYFNNSISKAWTERFSTTTGFSVSTLQYFDSIAEVDNRDYYRLFQSFRYKATPRTAYSINWTGEYVDRRRGSDSQSNFVTLGWEYAVAPNTTIIAKVGPQFKHTNFSGTDTYLFAHVVLSHKITDRAAIAVFFRHENESTNTYQSSRNYASNETYRAGVSGSYKLNHLWTARLGLNLINCNYSKGQDGLPDKDSTTWNCSAGLSYQATQNLLLRLDYSYTHGKNASYYEYDNKYDRNRYALSAVYTF